MKKNIWERKIPTLVGILFLVIGIGATSVLANRGTTLLSRASGDTQPHHLTVSNVSSTSATVSFTTTSAVIATLSYGTTNPTEVTLTDIRDKDAGPTTRNTHYFTLTNLTPNTTYTFKLTSGRDSYTENPDLPFSITTVEEKQAENKEYNVRGKVFLPDGEVGKDTILYFSSDKTAVMSTVSGIDGGFTLDLQHVLTKDKQDLAQLADTDVFLLIGTNGLLQTQATFRLDQASPLPNLTLSNTYNFSSLHSPQTVDEAIPAQGFPLQAEATTEIVTITMPRSLQKVSGSRPVFQGTSRANDTVEITVDADDPITARVLTNKQGQWTYRPTTDLAPGNYTISIKGRDDSRVLKTVTTSFSVIKQ